MASCGGDVSCLRKKTFDVNCSVCIKKELIKEALKYCRDCKKNLCADCVKLHTDLHGREHSVVDGHGEDSIENLLTEKCDAHPDKLIELYCIRHDVLACNVCGLLKHSTCRRKLKHITSCVDVLPKSRDLPKVSDELKGALKTAGNVVDSMDWHMTQQHLNESSIVDAIDDQAGRLIAKIKEMKDDAKKDVKTRHQTLLSLCNGYREEGETLKADIEQCIDDLQKTPTTRRAHFFIVNKKAQRMTDQINKLSVVCENLVKMRKLLFMTDPRIENSLRAFNVLGRVTDSERYMCTIVRRINVNIPSDVWRCDVRGCCFLPDGTLVINDAYNNKLKRVDLTKYAVTEHCSANKEIGEITRSQLDELSVRCQITDDKTPRTYVLDNNRGIRCIDAAGQEVFQRSCIKLGLESPLGIATDQKGMVFICGQDSQNVVQVSKDGSVVGEILSTVDGLVKPECICFDSTTYRLYVGGETSWLLEFELK